MATINGVEVIGDKTAHDYDLLDKDDGINLANGVERNRKATEDNHEDIVLHRTDPDVHVTPAWKNSLVTKATLGLYWTAAQTADIINEISIAGGAKLVKVDALPAVGLEQTIYLVPKQDPQQGDVFDEYVWVDGKYEFIGTTKADISNVVKYTDYATSTRGGVIKFSTSHGIIMSADGFLMGSTRTAEQYASNSGNMLINKGTLENVFASKGFAENADVVHLTGSETVDGTKTFISSPKVRRVSPYIALDISDCDVTETPTEAKSATLYFRDKNNKNLSYVVSQQRTNGEKRMCLRTHRTDNIDSYYSVDLDSEGNFYPEQQQMKLGTLSNKWADVNTSLINGKTPAYDADVVHKTGNETIDGVKTFASNITIQGGKKVVCNTDNSFLELNGGTTWGKGGSIVLSGQDRASYTNSVLIVSKNDTDTFIIEYQNGILKPRQGDNYLGTTASKWKDVNTELLNGEPVVTPNYLETKAEEWEFTLSDGSMVTKKIVMA